MRIDKDLVAASATPLVLGILADGESWGYAILKQVNELSSGTMTWTDGMLYPLLHRLERQGYVQAHWQLADNGRRRRHYAITPAGLDALAERRRQWVGHSRRRTGVADRALARLRAAATGHQSERRR
jgi:PadR family transcriptional regulator PadR